MITANWVANQTPTPAKPQTMLPTKPHGCGGLAGEGLGAGGTAANGSWLIGFLYHGPVAGSWRIVILREAALRPDVRAAAGLLRSHRAPPTGRADSRSAVRQDRRGCGFRESR